MRSITLIVAAVVFAGALIIDTGALLQIAAMAVLRSTGHGLIVAVALAGGAILAIALFATRKRRRRATRSRPRAVRRNGRNRRLPSRPDRRPRRMRQQG
jgi:hypothetical protein